MSDDVRIRLIRYFHGPFLSSILKAIGEEDTQGNKEKVKQLIKERCKVESMADLTPIEIGEIVTEVAIVFAREMGVMLPFPGEPDNVQDLSMKDFLALKKND